jgi:heme-degrading monooxygenase HmoA
MPHEYRLPCGGSRLREDPEMMTIVASITVKEGAESEWDATMRERFEAASQQPGWLGGQLCTPVDSSDQRVIIGTWRSRDDWET